MNRDDIEETRAILSFLAVWWETAAEQECTVKGANEFDDLSLFNIISHCEPLPCCISIATTDDEKRVKLGKFLAKLQGRTFNIWTDEGVRQVTIDSSGVHRKTKARTWRLRSRDFGAHLKYECFSTLAAEADAIDVSKLITPHLSTLSQKYRDGKMVDDYGFVEEVKWQKEIRYFLDRLLKAHSLVPSDADYEKLVTLVDKLTAEYLITQPEIIERDVTEMDGRQYEEYCGDLLRDAGFSVTVTQYTGDQGADIIATKNSFKIVVQCKNTAQPAGNKAIQEIYTAKAHHNATHAAVACPSGYTKAARQLAHSTGVILLHHNDLSGLALR